MNWICRLGGAVLVSLAMAVAVAAADAAKVAWHHDVHAAWKATQRHERPMLVFVTRQDCLYCTKMKDRTFVNATVAGAINRSFVPLALDGGTRSPLLDELNVTTYPTTVVISPQAVILDRIDGYVAPEALASRLNALRPSLPVAKVAKHP